MKLECRHFIADEERMKQVLVHLLSNAIGCSPEGGEVVLACGCEGEDVIFSVTDQGPGIPEDLKNTVFERFESSAVAGRHRGPGLGLAMVKSLVELHGGHVMLTSHDGGGTRALIRIPRSGILAKPSGYSEEKRVRQVELLELEDIVQDVRQQIKTSSRTGTGQ